MSLSLQGSLLVPLDSEAPALVCVCVYVCLSVSVFICACVCDVSKEASWSQDSEARLYVCMYVCVYVYVCDVSEAASWTQRPLRVCVCVSEEASRSPWTQRPLRGQPAEEKPEALRLSAGSQEADTSASKSWHLVWVVPELLLKVREKRGEEAETFSGGNTTSRAPGAGVSASWDRDGKEGSSRGVGLGVQDWVPAPAVSGKCCCLSTCVFSPGLSLSI